MRARLFSYLGFVTMGVAVAAVSCGSDGSAPRPSSNEQDPESFGSVGLSLSPVAGTSFDTISYVITGPGGFTRQGSIDTSHSSKLSTTVGGIPAGTGFSVSLSGTATDGSTSCTGSASFSVTARETTKVTVKLQCRETPKTGSVKVDGELNVCPLIDGVDANPAEALVGEILQLSATAHDADHEPEALSYAWSATSGTFSGAATATPSFTCTQAGTVTIKLEISDSDCGDSVETTVTCSVPTDAVQVVAATVETAPVPSSGDAADDPAVWVHPTNPELSLIIGTDKQGGGLGVYGLDGQLLQFASSGKLNNVDVRDGFPLGGSNVTLVTAGNRTDNSIAIFQLDAVTRSLSDVAARKITTLATYGSCMYRSPVSGKYYYFVDDKEGRIEQWELFESAGKVDAVKVRDLHQLSSQPEACAVDDQTHTLLVGEEDVGLWKFDAEPSVTSGPGWQGTLIASTEPGGHLVADVEGVAIAKTSPTTGFILVSNQGDSTYAVLTLEAPHSYVKTFEVARGSACIDPVTGSDGIEVSTANLGPAFPHGVFVTQDDTNDGANQNFKLVPLDHVFNGTTVNDSACDGGGGTGGSSNGGSSSGGSSSGGSSAGSSAGGSTAASGWGEPFCTTYCNKCASCYAAGGFDEGDCVYLQPKTAFTIEDCQAGCAVSRTPSTTAKGTLPEGFETLSCSAFDASI